MMAAAMALNCSCKSCSVEERHGSVMSGGARLRTGCGCLAGQKRSDAAWKAAVRRTWLEGKDAAAARAEARNCFFFFFFYFYPARD
ncbi:hypothetical protein M0R45_027795 [Rubus argutus]|uniref:Uncharacterized protein n=1 Tax=Rubus argutus TaxID=59490 RepID=A0AAW1X352_RUBAR